MKLEIWYEWDVETFDPDSMDILDHHHSDELGGEVSLAPNQELVLVYNEGNAEKGVVDRQWAYVREGKLPTHFGYDENCLTDRMVPERFHTELKGTYHE